MSDVLPQQRPATLTVDQALQQAVAHHQAGQLQDAERLYRAILQTQPDHPDANHNLGILAVQVRQPVASLPHFKAALEACQDVEQYWLSYIDALMQADQTDAAKEVLARGRNVGLQGDSVEALADRLQSKSDSEPNSQEISRLTQLFAGGDYTAAIDLAQEMTERFPLHGLGWKGLGTVLKQLGRTNDALIPLRKAAALMPSDAEAHSNLGNTLRELGKPDEAMTSCRLALEVKPDFAGAHSNLGLVLHEVGKPDEAVTSYGRALQIKPDFAEAYSNLGSTQRDLGQLDTAVASYRRALELNPTYAEAHNNLGSTLRDLSKLDEAVTSYNRALEIKPNLAEAYCNRGVALQEIGRLDEAVTSYGRALQIKPDFAEAYSNLGSTQRDLGQLDTAVTSCRLAVQIKPDFADAKYNLGNVLLLMGSFEEGWLRYESRHDPSTTKRSSLPPLTTIPQWRGESIAGKAILAWCEQGLGDQIQFWRYLPILKTHGTRRITLVCATPLESLFSRAGVVDEVFTFAEAKDIPPHDYWTFLLSIPHYCHTTLENIPAMIHYLYADDNYQHDMAIQLANIPEFKVGVCWQGGKTYFHDAERSPGLESFKQLFTLNGVRFFTLQPGGRDEFLLAAGASALDIGHEIDALTPPFEETAALIMNLDLVITCDTSIGHLAGALGKPVWVVLPFVPDWRWMMDREDSPWYPNTRLFRQFVRGDWGEVFERVAQRLESVIARELPVLAITDESHQLREKGQANELQAAEEGVLAERLRMKSASGPSPQEITRLEQLFTEGRYTEVESVGQQMTERFPLHGFGWKALGTALIHMGRTNEALMPMRKASTLMPEDLEAKDNLGNAQFHFGQFDEALSSYRRALEISPHYAKSWNNLGNVQRALGQLDEAAASFSKALEINPNYHNGHNNLGAVLQDLGQLDAAVASYHQALKIKPDFAKAHYNLGHVTLLLGKFAAGFRRYESRFDSTVDSNLVSRPKITFPQWQGESLLGKSLLVWYEQGIGDQIQFCRYLPTLRDKGTRRITLVCAAPLKSLLKRLDDADEVLTIAEAENAPTHDYWTFPLSLPLYCNTTLGNIPTAIPYLYADDNYQQDMAIQLANIPEFKVGVCWQGGKAYPKDAERSPGLEPFRKLFTANGVRFATLQPDSRDQFLLAAGSAVLDLGHEIDAGTPPFEETAALIMNLDLVITCDTSIGHLAGALGRPVWVVLPFVPDWRWMMDREDSPWYPNTRLFRQKNRGDWGELFERVAQRLESVIAGEFEAVWSLAKAQ